MKYILSNWFISSWETTILYIIVGIENIYKNYHDLESIIKMLKLMIFCKAKYGYETLINHVLYFYIFSFKRFWQKFNKINSNYSFLSNMIFIYYLIYIKIQVNFMDH